MFQYELTSKSYSSEANFGQNRFITYASSGRYDLTITWYRKSNFTWPFSFWIFVGFHCFVGSDWHKDPNLGSTWDLGEIGVRFGWVGNPNLGWGRSEVGVKLRWWQKWESESRSKNGRSMYFDIVYGVRVFLIVIISAKLFTIFVDVPCARFHAFIIQWLSRFLESFSEIFILGWH